MVNNHKDGLAFQEYSEKFPHKQFTLGYAGRPGGPAFYISTVDNTHNHGPGSQGSRTEADGIIGKLLDIEKPAERPAGGEASSRDILMWMQRQPGGMKGSGFVNGKENFIEIVGLKRVFK